MTTCELPLQNGLCCHTPRAPRFRSAFRRILELLETWHERAEQRRQLREMPEHLIRDMGISAADVHRETSKPFWRA